MGIENANIFIERFRGGVYAKPEPKVYVDSIKKHGNCHYLYVDGELVSFKGFNADARSDLEIAVMGKLYLINRIDEIERYFNIKFDKILVFMDGKRVHNKIMRNTSVIKYQVQNEDGTVEEKQCPRSENTCREVWREMFCEQMEPCTINCVVDSRIKLIRLSYGESELIMYLKRFHDVKLNVFLTGDSDIMPIIYNHEPIFVPKAVESSSPSTDQSTSQKPLRDGKIKRSFNEVQPLVSLNSTVENDQQAQSRNVDTFLCSFGLTNYREDVDHNKIIIKDDNSTYGENLLSEVRDSCVWVRCLPNSSLSSYKLELFGCDYIKNKIKIPTLVYRTACFLAGTDFSQAMLTPMSIVKFNNDIEGLLLSIIKTTCVGMSPINSKDSKLLTAIQNNEKTNFSDYWEQGKGFLYGRAGLEKYLKYYNLCGVRNTQNGVESGDNENETDILACVTISDENLINHFKSIDHGREYESFEFEENDNAKDMREDLVEAVNRQLFSRIFLSFLYATVVKTKARVKKMKTTSTERSLVSNSLEKNNIPSSSYGQKHDYKLDTNKPTEFGLNVLYKNAKIYTTYLDCGIMPHERRIDFVDPGYFITSILSEILEIMKKNKIPEGVVRPEKKRKCSNKPTKQAIKEDFSGYQFCEAVDLFLRNKFKDDYDLLDKISL